MGGQVAVDHDAQCEHAEHTKEEIMAFLDHVYDEIATHRVPMDAQAREVLYRRFLEYIPHAILDDA